MKIPRGSGPARGNLLDFRVRPYETHFPVSRDFGIGSIPCDLTACICNKNKKCEVPSRIKINAKGYCSGFQSEKGNFEF